MRPSSTLPCLAALVGGALLGACGAPPAEDDAVAAEPQALAGPGCTGPSIPTWCRPDLFVSSSYALVYAPGNPQNYAPGYYITWVIKNGGVFGAAASSAEIRDHAGLLLKTVSVPALTSGSTATATIVAPYECGWRRVLSLDVNHAVAESNEGNNLATWDHSCP